MAAVGLTKKIIIIIIINELTSKLQYNRAVESHCAHIAKKHHGEV